MKLFGLILLILSIFGIVYLIDEKKDGKFNKITNKDMFKFSGCLACLATIGLSLFQVGLFKEANVDLSTGRTILVVVISLVMSGCLFFVLTSNWYRLNVINSDETKVKLAKVLRILSFVLGLGLIPLLFGFIEIISPIFTYPLNNYILTFGKNSNGETIGVTYYAVFIILGALCTYLISDYRVQKAGYKKGSLENLLYIAFPAGIVGARIWYVIANWQKEFAGQPFGKVFAIWNGGLAIQGGVILGALVGIIYMLKKHKEIDIFFLVDTIIPGILIAQAIGRWGNFVNKEVFGLQVARETWGFLPNWILNQMTVTGTDKIYTPLFLVESVCNILGYILIVYVIGKGLKKYLVKGDLCCAYFVVYGIIRFVLEPLRDPEYKMGLINGVGVEKSKVMAGVFIVAGIIGIVVLHVLDYKKNKKAKEEKVSEEAK